MRITHPRRPRAFESERCLAVDVDRGMELDKHEITWQLDTGAKLLFEGLTAWEVACLLESAGWFDAAQKFRAKWADVIAEELKPT